MHPSNGFDSYPQKPGASAPPSSPPPVNGIPVQPNYYGAPNNPQPPAGLQARPINNGPWSSGLFRCCEDVPTCCLSFWCPCIAFGRIAEIVDNGTVPCVAHGALYTFLNFMTCCACCCYSCIYRTKMRHQHQLQEEPCHDCLVHFFCEYCALAQEYRELERRGFDLPLGWHGNMAMQNRGIPMAPVPPEGMMR